MRQRVQCFFSKHPSGFTLVEILVSLTILAVVALSVIGLSTHSQKFAVDMQHRWDALEIAGRQIAEMKAKGISSYADSGYGHPLEGEGRAIPELPNAQMRVFTRTIEEDPDLKHVLVEVSWEDLRGERISDTLMTVVYDE
ncbi:MAG: type IV pilus modification PilV family protein [Candidatus Omnitrophota bacterium]